MFWRKQKQIEHLEWLLRDVAESRDEAWRDLKVERQRYVTLQGKYDKLLNQHRDLADWAWRVQDRIRSEYCVMRDKLTKLEKV